LELNVTHQLLVYADDNMRILGGSVYTMKKSTEALVVVVRGIGLEANVINLSLWSCLEASMQDKITT
jgi:hypothetical protein